MAAHALPFIVRRMAKRQDSFYEADSSYEALILPAMAVTCFLTSD
jgi:hypothetical protein